MTLKVSFTEDVMRWLDARGKSEVVIDLTYKQGRCTGAFCRVIPSIEVYAGKAQGRYSFEEVLSREGRSVHVAKPLIDKGLQRDIQAVVDRDRFGGLKIRGIDPYELGL